MGCCSLRVMTRIWSETGQVYYGVPFGLCSRGAAGGGFPASSDDGLSVPFRGADPHRQCDRLVYVVCGRCLWRDWEISRTKNQKILSGILLLSRYRTVGARIYIRLYSHTNYNTRHGPLLIAYRAVIRVFRRFAPYLSCTRVFTRRCGCGEWALAYKRKKRKPAPAVGTDYSIRNTASGAGPWAFELFIPIRAGPPARSAA